jgi:XTP/dITP diphosphohydrolase
MSDEPYHKILIASGNDGKIKEMGDEFRELGVSVTSPKTEGFSLERPEAGVTYHDNARIKAEEAFEKSKIPSLADDSGLEVDFLNGKPGVHSDRWGGPNYTADDKNSLLLEKLDGTPPEKRTARFVCTMVLFDNEGEHLRTSGVCEGRIATEPRGEGGFGYDPVFEVQEAGWKTFAELDKTVKQWLSHRAIALNEMISLMKQERLIPKLNSTS